MRELVFDLQRFASKTDTLQSLAERLETADDISSFVGGLYGVSKDLVADVKNGNIASGFFDTISGLLTVFKTFAGKLPTGGLASSMASFEAAYQRAQQDSTQENWNDVVTETIDLVGEIAKLASNFAPKAATLIVSTPYIGVADLATTSLKTLYLTAVDKSKNLADTFVDEWLGEIDNLFGVLQGVTTSKITSLDYSDGVISAGNGVNSTTYGSTSDDKLRVGSNKTVHGGAGDDSIELIGENHLIVYSSGAGNDTVYGFGKTDTLSIYGGGHVTTSGSDVIIHSGDGSVILKEGRPKILNIIFSDGTDTSPALSVVGSNAAELVKNSLDGSTISLLGGNDSVGNYGDSVVIDGGADNDSISNGDSNVTILSDTGDDTITNGGSNVTIDAGTGSDSVINWGNNVTIVGGSDSDIIENENSHVTITGGDGNDSIHSRIDENVYQGNILIDGGDGDDDFYNESHDTTLLGGAGNDIIKNYARRVTVDGGADDDHIYSRASSLYEFVSSINGGDGDDTIIHDGADLDTVSAVTITGGDGNDSINNAGRLATIHGGNGNDTIRTTGKNFSSFSSIFGGDGDDVIFCDEVKSAGCFNATSINSGKGDDTIYSNGGFWGEVQFEYVVGDGNDVIYKDDYSSVAISITGDEFYYATNDNDLVLKVDNGSITVKDYKYENVEVNLLLNVDYDKLKFTNSEGSSLFVFGVRGKESPSTTTGGSSSTSTTTGGGSSSTTKGGSSTSTTTGGGSSSTTKGGSSSSSTTTGGSSTSTTRGGTSSTSTTTGSSSTSTTRGGSSSTSTSTTTGGGSSSTTKGGSSSTSTTTGGGSSTTRNTGSTTTTNNTQNIYTGGDKTISNYSGQAVMLGAYTGANFNGNNFVVNSPTGALVIENATDKIVDLRDGAGNAFIKAYTPSTAGVIDGRGLAGYEIISGAANGTDVIFAGDGGSSLWGGSGLDADAIAGGNGSDIFIGGRLQGADNFYNVSSAHRRSRRSRETCAHGRFNDEDNRAEHAHFFGEPNRSTCRIKNRRRLPTTQERLRRTSATPRRKQIS